MTVRTAAVTVAALLAFAAPAAARSEQVTVGSVTATLTWTEREDGPPYAEDQHLVITDAGEVVVDEHVPDDEFLTPGGVLTDRKSLRAHDFDGDGTVEVVLDEYTGGAHCCFLAWIYHGADKTERNFGDDVYRFRDLDDDAAPEFVATDPAFTGVFTSSASSQRPIQVLDWQGTELVDISRSEGVRPRVERQAARFRARYDAARRRLAKDPDDLGAEELIRATLAAYTADQCLLGRCGRGFRLIRRAAKREEVRASFERQARRLLRREGYLS